MPVETIDDRTLMLADFGVLCTLTKQAGGSVTFTAIFDNEHQLEDAGGGVSFSVLQPQLTCKDSDVSGVQYGDSVSVTGQGNYKVVVIMPDGTGMTELRLEAQ